jgi:hypothetical protein
LGSNNAGNRLTRLPALLQSCYKFEQECLTCATAIAQTPIRFFTVTVRITVFCGTFFPRMYRNGIELQNTLAMSPPTDVAGDVLPGKSVRFLLSADAVMLRPTVIRP